jgi:hypothetical protein
MGMEETPKPTRRWFRFSLRTMLVVVTLVCLLFGLAQPQLALIREREAFLDREDIGWNSGVPAPGILWMFGARGAYFVEVPLGDYQLVSEAKRLFPEAEYRWYWPNSRGPCPGNVDLGWVEDPKAPATQP